MKKLKLFFLIPIFSITILPSFLFGCGTSETKPKPEPTKPDPQPAPEPVDPTPKGAPFVFYAPENFPKYFDLTKNNYKKQNWYPQLKIDEKKLESFTKLDDVVNFWEKNFDWMDKSDYEPHENAMRLYNFFVSKDELKWNLESKSMPFYPSLSMVAMTARTLAKEDPGKIVEVEIFFPLFKKKRPGPYEILNRKEGKFNDADEENNISFCFSFNFSNWFQS